MIQNDEFNAETGNVSMVMLMKEWNRKNYKIKSKTKEQECWWQYFNNNNNI